MSFSTTIATAWSSGNTHQHPHSRHTTHPTNLYVSTSSTTNNALKRRQPSGTSLASLSPDSNHASPSSSASPPLHKHQQPQASYSSSKPRHRSSLSVSSIASSLASSLPSISANTTNTATTTMSSPQKKLCPPSSSSSAILDHQGLTRIAAEVGSSLALLSKKASSTFHQYHPSPQHQQYSYQVVSGYALEPDEAPQLAFSSSASSSSSSSTSPSPLSPCSRTFSNMSNSSSDCNSTNGTRKKDRRDKDQGLKRASSSSSSTGGGGGGGPTWFGSLRGLVLAGTSASRGAFSPLTTEDKDRHSDSEHEEDDEEDDDEQDEQGATDRKKPFGLEGLGLGHASSSDNNSLDSNPPPQPPPPAAATIQGNGFWDREMDEDKYGVRLPHPPPPPPLGKSYRAPRWQWSMLDPTQLSRSLLAPLYQSVPGSAAAADLDEHLAAAAAVSEVDEKSWV